jgi:hypothetical protein
VVNEQKRGVPPSGSGCQPLASAPDGSSRSGIPNARIAPIALAGAALQEAYDYIKAPNDPPFEELGMGYRILALAAAMVAAGPLLEALRAIREMETPYGNATVKRMVARAASAIEAATAGETVKTGPTEGESAVPQADAPEQSA